MFVRLDLAKDHAQQKAFMRCLQFRTLPIVKYDQIVELDLVVVSMEFFPVSLLGEVFLSVFRNWIGPVDGNTTYFAVKDNLRSVRQFLNRKGRIARLLNTGIEQSLKRLNLAPIGGILWNAN